MVVQILMGQHKEEGCVCEISLTMVRAAGHFQNVLDNIAYFTSLLWGCVSECRMSHFTSVQNDHFRSEIHLSYV